MYLRNLFAHGYLAVALALPGLFFCLRSGNIRRQSVAVAWLVLVTFMQLLEFKEVRYLGFLAPLTALLVVAALDAIMGSVRLSVGGPAGPGSGRCRRHPRGDADHLAVLQQGSQRIPRPFSQQRTNWRERW